MSTRQDPSFDRTTDVDSIGHRDGWLVELTLDEGLESETRLGLKSTTGRRASDKGILPIQLEDYSELLDWTGRLLRSDKAGSIPLHLAPILDRLGIKGSLWQDLITNYHEWFGRFVGTSQQLRDRAAASGRAWNLVSNVRSPMP